MRSRALAVVAVVATAGCNQLFGLDSVAVGADSGPTGDGGVDASLPTTWSAPRLLTEVMSEKADEDPSMSSDGLELYLAVHNLVNNYDIARYVRTSTALPWTEEPTIATINSATVDWTPRLSSDDRTLYFASDRNGGPGSADIWFSTRTGNSAASTWSTPLALTMPSINTAAEERGATPCGAGQRFVFTSPRDGNLDLFEIELGGTATPIPGASDDDFVESSPFISEDCLTLYFSSTQHGDPDILVMTRPGVDSEWGPPTPVPNLSTEDYEGDPWVSADGRYMLLAIDTLPIDGDFDIYESFR